VGRGRDSSSFSSASVVVETIVVMGGRREGLAPERFSFAEATVGKQETMG
jgi:hypothetical protein